MPLGRSIESLLLRYNRLNDRRQFVGRVLREPRRFRERRQAAREFLERPSPELRLDQRVGYGRTPPFSDEEFSRYFSREDLVPITGPAGTVAIVDTSRCAHFGSRCRRNGRRLAFVIHYTMFAAYSTTYMADFQDLNLATSPELRARMTEDRRRRLVYRLVRARA